MASTIAAYSGGALPAAIGIVRVSGPEAGAIMARVFVCQNEKAITQRKTNTLYYGKLLARDGHAVDLCMAAFYKAPRSYTGEDMGEIFCHGSQAVVAAALEHCYACGAVPAQAGEFTKRAFLAGKLDLTEAEAVADLIESKSEQAAKNAVSQLEGRISGELAQMRVDITGVLSHYYAVCDYPDEEIDPFEYGEAADKLTAAADKLAALYDSYRRGATLRDGVPVAVIGRPNAGKSSLFNALAGFERAIVTSEAGTTRDVVEQAIQAGGGLFRLLDTAGIRQAQGLAEGIGIEKALEAADSADIVLCVVDGAGDLTEDDLRALRTAAGKRRALVLNKSDLGQKLTADEVCRAVSAPFDATFSLSATTGEGVGALAEWLASQSPKPQEVLVTSARQAGLMRMAADDLRAAAAAAKAGMTADAFLADAERAVKTLGEITGEQADADIVHGIFSRFCVGK